MAYADYWNELLGTVPKLPSLAAQRYVQRAWYDIRDLRPWSFLFAYADLTLPALINSGTFTVTQGSATAVADATAITALQAVIFSIPPLASSTLGEGRNIRFRSNEPLYYITAFDPGTGNLTLDRVYTGSSGSGVAYSCYKAYYSAPTDFLRYVSIVNKSTGYTIRGRRLTLDQTKLNSVDPQRSSTGDPYNLSVAWMDAISKPVHELYPHPTSSNVLTAWYQKRGADLSDSNDLPSTLPSSLLISRALYHAATWALGNVSTYPELGGTNWLAFAQAKLMEYKEGLKFAVKQDDELKALLPIYNTVASDFPLGGQFLQAHDVSSLIGGID